MEDRRSGGIVAAVTLTITIAFLVVTVLFLRTATGLATSYAQDASDLYASQLSFKLVSYVQRQYTLAESPVLDERIADALARERVSAGPKGQEARDEKVARGLAELMEPLVLDAESCMAFAVSDATHGIYTTQLDDSNLHYSDKRTTQLLYAAHEASLSAIGSPANKVFVRNTTELMGEPCLAMCRPLENGDVFMGVVGVFVRGKALEKIIEQSGAEEGQSAVCFFAGGTVLASSDPGYVAGTDLFEGIPGLVEEGGELPGEGDEPLHSWSGLDGFLPRNQELSEVVRVEELNAYLLTKTTAEDVFSAMRTRASTLVLALTVVMALLLLMVMYIVRWYRARLIKVATTDELTGLANRRSFALEFEQLTRAKDFERATLVLIDVDKFKLINDTFGHAGGDRALAAVAAETARMVKGCGIAGRWGGDEFIALLCEDHDDALADARDMVRRVASLALEGGIRVTVSMGTSVVDVTQPLERAVEHADDALYVTKEGGRGFLTDYRAGITPHMAGEKAAGASAGVAASAAALGADSAAAPAAHPDAKRKREHVSWRSRLHELGDLVVESALEAVHWMVPFVAGGGILIAIAFLIDGSSVNLATLPAEARANFGSITPVAATLKAMGSAAFNFMLPIFAAFFARGLAGDKGFMAGFAGGYIASQGSAGFAGAIMAAVVAAVVVNLMRGFMRETSKTLRRVAPVLIYPVFSLLTMCLLMTFVIEPAATAFDAWLTSLLVSLGSGSRVVLGMVAGAMMATDMGGPINKAAYHVGTAAIAAGNPDIMAAVMVGGMVPPCGIALCILLFQAKFTDAERDQAASAFFMGLSFITEGAIPFVITDFLRVIPCCMLGSALAGALSEAYGCALMAPHGGIFVLPVVENPAMYLMALVAGSIATALSLGMLKRRVDSTG